MLKVFIGLFFITVVLTLAIPAYSKQSDVATSECTELLTIEENTPKEILEAASGIIIFSRETLSFRFIQIADALSDQASSGFAIPYARDNLDSVQPFAVLSPDKTKVLQTYEDLDGQRLLIITSLSRNIDSMTVFGDESWNIYPYWLNSTEVVVGLKEDSIRSYTYRLVNTDTNDENDFRIEIPSNLGIPLQAPLISPDESQIAYGQASLNVTYDFVIGDLAENQFITIPLLGPARQTQWSPQGDFVAVADNPDGSNSPLRLSIIDKFGAIVTNVPIHHSRNVVMPTYEFQWSPDGQKLMYRDGEASFRGGTEPFPKVVDSKSLKVIEICIPSEAFWSPDSRYLALFNRTNITEITPSNVVGVFIYDFMDNRIYEVPIDDAEDIGRVAGWSHFEN